MVLRVEEWDSIELYACGVCAAVYADRDRCRKHEGRCLETVRMRETTTPRWSEGKDSNEEPATLERYG